MRAGRPRPAGPDAHERHPLSCRRRGLGSRRSAVAQFAVRYEAAVRRTWRLMDAVVSARDDHPPTAGLRGWLAHRRDQLLELAPADRAQLAWFVVDEPLDAGPIDALSVFVTLVGALLDADELDVGDGDVDVTAAATSVGALLAAAYPDAEQAPVDVAGWCESYAVPWPRPSGR